jgi:hypothetical protein
MYFVFYYWPVFGEYYYCTVVIVVGGYFVNCFSGFVFKFYVIVLFDFVVGSFKFYFIFCVITCIFTSG